MAIKWKPISEHPMGGVAIALYYDADTYTYMIGCPYYRFEDDIAVEFMSCISNGDFFSATHYCELGYPHA